MNDAPSLSEIEAARRALTGQILNSPLTHSQTLSAMLDAEVWLKHENLQFTGSFKDRGALNKLLGLDEAARRAGVIAMSAGNHAQGVAYHAKRLGIAATIVMPEGTPFVKVTGTEVLGATVKIVGESVEEAYAFARDYGAAHGLSFVHPYDDPLVIAGQGTIGLELTESGVALDAVIVPVGGGGLIAGVATALKALKPNVRVYGVQTALYPAMRQVLRGLPLSSNGPSVADGIAVKEPGRLTRAIVERLVDDILLVDEETIERAMLALLEIEKTVVEGAGAASLAALMTHRNAIKGRAIGLILSGGNVDPRLLSSVIIRALVHAGRVARLRLAVPDRPGMLAEVARLIGETQANILEVYHERAFGQHSARATGLIVMVETRDEHHVATLTRDLEAAGFAVERLAPGAALSA